jgi:hypothetical protein
VNFLVFVFSMSVLNSRCLVTIYLLVRYMNDVMDLVSDTETCIILVYPL